MNRVVVRCPAKINPFLAVGPIDRRGYHPLRTIFQAIELHDVLSAEFCEADVFECDVDLPSDNTVTKAWRLLKELAPTHPMRIRLEKRIPSEAGLGGGSSDAVGLIRAVEALEGYRLPDHERLGIARAVGADVPFFLVGGRAKGERYGDRLTPLEDLPPRPVVVLKPAVGCPTGLMYAALDAQTYPWREFPDDDAEVYNDFERVAPCECLDLIERLRVHGAESAGLSGSGSAVFGMLPNSAGAGDAEAMAERLARETGCAAWATRTLTRSQSFATETP